MSADFGGGTREVARRLFAAEYDDATLSYSESDEERAPNYVVTPTGARVNRLFAVGVLTATESVNEDMLRARVVDPTGAFVAYAGQYQPDALAFFERTTPPAFVALTAKARTFQPEDSEQVFTSARPETVNEVDADTRDRWVVSAAAATLRRVSLFDAALSSGLRGDDLEVHLREHGVEEALAAGIPRAIEHYGTTTAYLEAMRELALDALAVVAGEREEVRELSLSPGEGGAAALGTIPEKLRADGTIATAESTATTEPASVEEPETATATTDATAADETTVDDATTTDDALAGDDPATTGESTAEATASAMETAEATESDEPIETAETTDSDSSTETAAPDSTTEASSPDSETGTDEPDGLGEFDDSIGDADDDSDGELSDFDTEDEEATASESVEGGDGDADTADADDVAAADIEDVAEDDLYEFDEEERQAVKDEHGLSFESGAEVDSPGEAGIETPEEEPTGESNEEPTGESNEEPSSAPPSGESTPPDEELSTETSAESSDGETDDAPVDEQSDAADVELTEVVVDVMGDLDEGDGADREEVIAAVVQRHGFDPGAVDDAIQEALMDGKCYEPGEDRLKAI